MNTEAKPEAKPKTKVRADPMMYEADKLYAKSISIKKDKSISDGIAIALAFHRKYHSKPEKSQ